MSYAVLHYYDIWRPFTEIRLASGDIFLSTAWMEVNNVRERLIFYIRRRNSTQETENLVDGEVKGFINSFMRENYHVGIP